MGTEWEWIAGAVLVFVLYPAVLIGIIIVAIAAPDGLLRLTGIDRGMRPAEAIVVHLALLIVSTGAAIALTPIGLHLLLVPPLVIGAAVERARRRRNTG